MRLVLASASTRRADLLRAAGFAFEVRPVAADETPLPGESPDACVRRLARLKAELGARTAGPDAVVIGADTVVVADGAILGKPETPSAASDMLRRLSGRVHEVLTGVAVARGTHVAIAVERTLVHFTQLTEEDLAWYVASGEPADKAGAYGIQGLASRFVDRIEGSYSNVVGLPVSLVVRLLRQVTSVEALAGPA